MERLEIIQLISAIVVAAYYEEHTRKPARRFLRWMAPEVCRLEACQKNICAVGRQNLRVGEGHSKLRAQDLRRTLAGP